MSARPRFAFRAVLILSTLLLVLGQRQMSQAQASTSLVIRLTQEVSGFYSLWTWAGGNWSTLVPEPYAGNPILSPDGKRIAYQAPAKLLVEAIQQAAFPNSSTAASDIWVLDLSTKKTVQIAEQPSGAIFDQAAGLQNVIIRSDPTWSPDGKTLAWSEHIDDNGTSQDRIALYRFDKKKTTFFPTPEQNGAVQTMPITWGKPGIGLISVTSQPGCADTDVTVIIMQSDGRGRTFAKVQGVDDNFNLDFSVPLIWADNGGKFVLTHAISNSFFDPANGHYAARTGTIELTSTTVTKGLTIASSGGTDDVTWSILVSGQGAVSIGSINVVDQVGAVTISPDGQQAAFVSINPTSNEPQLSVYAHGQVSVIAPPPGYLLDSGALAWGPIGWRLNQTP